jgi:hypothetical protein
VKPKPKAQLVPPLPKPEPALVDEYAGLREKMKAWKPSVNPHAARFAELGALILKCYEEYPAAEPTVAEGFRYRLPITARRFERKIIDLAGFLKKVGRQKFLSMCNVTLGAVEKEIPEGKRALYISTKQSGPRQIGEPVTREAVERRAAA